MKSSNTLNHAKKPYKGEDMLLKSGVNLARAGLLTAVAQGVPCYTGFSGWKRASGCKFYEPWIFVVQWSHPAARTALSTPGDWEVIQDIQQPLKCHELSEIEPY